MDRQEGYPPGHRAFLVFVAALGLGAVFLALVLLLGSCAARLEGRLDAEGGARLDFSAEMPAPIAAKLRKLGGAGAGSPIFDAAAFRSSIAAAPYLSLVDLAQPSPESMRGALLIRSLGEAAAGTGGEALAGQGLLAYSRGPGWAELALRLDRGRAGALQALIPGLDPYLLEALSPPALEEEGPSAAEYRGMLKSILGDKAMPAMEGAAISLSISAPGEVLSFEGGRLEGRSLKLRIPIIDALVLEEPIGFRLRWKQ